MERSKGNFVRENLKNNIVKVVISGKYKNLNKITKI